MRYPSHSAFPVRLALMVVFAAAAALPRSAAAQSPQARAATKAEYEGWRQYMTNCARCHGDDGVGGVMAPDLRKAVASDTLQETTFRTTVTEGRVAKGMPSFEHTLHTEQIDAIYAYLRARASGELPAGRPKSQ